MTQYTWSVNTSGSWGTEADWGPNGLPTDLDAVTIGVPGITVSVGTGVAAAAYTLTTNRSGLLVSGGTLRTIQLATFNGLFTETAGTFTVSGMGAIFNGAMNLSGGTIDVASGSLQMVDGGSLSGTLTGAGSLNIEGGSTFLNLGFKSTLGSIIVSQGGKLGFNTSFAYSRNITVDNGVFNMFGHALSSNSTLLFSGVMGDGTFNDFGAGQWTFGTTAYTTTLDNGAIVNVSATLTQTNLLSLGVTDSGAKIVVTKTGHYAINGNWDILDPSSVGSITNAGVFAKTGGGKLAQIDAGFSSTGTVQAGIGELQLNGLVNALSGTVSGGGTLGIAGGQTTLAPGLALKMAVLHQESGVLVLNAAQSYAGEWDMTSGVLNLNAPGAVLTLSGRDSFDGGVVTGYGGGLSLSGSTEFGTVTIGGPETINVIGTGSIDQTGFINFGISSNPVINIASTASWRVESDGDINGFFGLINNAGLFSDANGSGDAIVQAELVNTGTLIVNSTLTLAGATALGGTLAGTGLLALSGNSTLDAGVAIRVAAIDVSSLTVLGGNLSDAGVFSETGAGVLDSGGHTLALSGSVSLDQGTLTDFGTLSSAGHTTVGGYTVTGGAELLISGTADQDGILTLANSAGVGTLDVAATGNYTVLDDLDISGTGLVTLAGVLTESGTGTANINSTLNLTSGGTLAANDQTLTLSGGGMLAGALVGTGRINLSAGSYALASGFAALSAGLEVSNNGTALLTANQAYAGDFISSGATFDLGGNTLSLTGTASLGTNDTIAGPGVLLASASSTLGALNITGNATLQISGSAEQLGTLQIGDPLGGATTASLAIVKGGSDTLAAYASLDGNGTVSVAGTLLAGGNGLSQIMNTIVDAGVIAANLGTLQVQGSVTAGSTGIFSIGSAGLLDFSSTSTIGLATGVSFAGTGTLRIEDLKSFGATIENFALNDTIQISGLNGNSLTGTYGNAAQTEIVVSDGSNSIGLFFSTAQTLSSLSFTAGVNMIATITHH